MRWPLLLPIAAMASACSLRTGDELVDEVISRVGPFDDCVRVGQTQIFKEDDELGPPAMLVPSSFKAHDLRAVAGRVAKPWRNSEYGQPAFYGDGTIDDCAMTVNSALVVDDFAFVSYSDPGGTIGAYAFQRKGDDWQVREKVQIGFW